MPRTTKPAASAATIKNALPGSDNVTRVELSNGIIVLVRENFSNKSVILTGSLEVGAIYEPVAKTGIASFVASALMRGTKHRDFDTLHGELEGIGASFGVSGNTHTTAFGGKALAEDLPTLLKLGADGLMNPAFPADQTERLRGEILTSLKIRAQDTRAVAGNLFRTLAYPPEHPYSRSPSGEPETINAISLADMAEFHAKHFGPRGMIIIVVGAVRAQDAIQQVEAAFGKWRNAHQPAIPKLPAAPRLTDIKEGAKSLSGKTQSDIIIGWPGPSRFAPDFQAANLANNILGVFGMMGRLGHTVREKQGLAYYAGSRLRGGPGQGSWTISAGVNPANVQKAIKSILKEVEKITTKAVSERDLEDNKANFISRLPLTLESNEGVAGSIMNMETYHLGLDYLRGYADMINAITREDLLKAAQQYLSPTAYALASAGPQDA